MAKARFKTRLTKKQKRNDFLWFLIIIGLSYAFVLFFGYNIGLFEDDTVSEAMMFALALSFFILSMLIFPMMIAGAVLGLQKGRAKRVRDNATFAPVQNLEYYRDSLNGLSPALVSLLIDMDIYGEKDVVATLLRMQRKGAIRFEQSEIIVQAQNKQTLDGGEYELLQIVKSGKSKWKANKNAILNWRINRFYEAEELGYIKKKSEENKLSYISVLLGVLAMFSGFILWGMFLGLDMFDMQTPADLLIVIPMLLIIDALFFTPMYLLTKWSAYNRRFKIVTWERTALGNETAEKIYGLARFIHEFSLLSEAKKEQVALWDDYLVYAIVLEENEQIVKDICRQYKIDLHNLGGKSLTSSF